MEKQGESCEPTNGCGTCICMQTTDQVARSSQPVAESEAEKCGGLLSVNPMMHPTNPISISKFLE
jgi:hypothetical protein